MKNQSIRQRLLHSTVIGGAALMALVGVPSFVLLPPTPAFAQDYTNGTLNGHVQDTSGRPVGGAQISVRSVAQGVVRTTTADANGDFRVALIPTGQYEVTVAAGGFDGATNEVAVTLGGASGYDFTISPTGGAAASLDDVVVTGVRPQVDFTRTTTGITVNVDELIDEVPIARNITAVTLLAPGAIAGDTSFGVGSAQLQAPPSLSGASPAENAFFINGLNTTNFINGLGGAPVPFEFYRTVEVKTGGYNAEFGRATGGVINAVTKSGSNEFIVELHGTWAPDALREDAPNGVSTPQFNGSQHSLGSFEEKTLTLEVGGPILRDRLFAYGIVAYQDTESTSANTAGTYVEDVFSDDPFYGVKVDGYITDDHRLEFTYFNTERTRHRTSYGFDPATDVINPTPLTTDTLNQGGDNWVTRYTGSFTDWLTLSAAYGESTVDQASVGSLTAESLVTDSRLGVGNLRRSRQTSAATTVPFLAERTFYRADADIYFSLLGDHHVRLGFDHEDTLLTETSVRNGGFNVTYRTATATNTLGLAPGQEYIETRIFETGGGFGGVNEAYYIQDSWDVTDRLNLQLGFRNDTFSIADPNGTTFIDFDGEKAARLGFAYDPTGDSSSKFYGSYGRYYLPPASNTAFRIASPAIDVSEFFRPAGGGATITTTPGGTGGLDPVTGRPTAGFGPQITAGTGATSLQPCPGGVGANAAAGTVACSVRDDGSSTPPELITARNLASTYEDEWRIGYENRVNDLWTVGVNVTYRNMGRVVEDALLDQGVIAYCQREGIPLVLPGAAQGCAEQFPGQSYYLIINPGFDVVATLPVTFAGEAGPRTITLNARDLGLPKARREYTALEFSFERAFDGVWGLQGSYVLSRSEGNYEGAVKSDLGQTDSGIVTDFDFLAFIPGSGGLLPNHRGHQFKAFGSWQATENLLVGANLSIVSPRPYGCLGLAPPGFADGQTANDSYGAISRFCGGNVIDRGTAFEADWTTRFDMSFRYSLDDLVPGNLTLRADIFNVFNLQSGVEFNESGEDDAGNPEDDFGQPVTYQPGRSVRIGFDWAF